MLRSLVGSEMCIRDRRERGLRGNGSNANTKICSEVRAPSSTSPPSRRRIFNPLSCPPRTPTEGTSTEEDFVQPGVPNFSLNQQPPPRLYKHNPPHQEGYKQSPTPPLIRGSKSQSQPLPKREQTPLQSTSTKEGYTNTRRVYNLEASTTSNNLFSHKQGS